MNECSFGGATFKVWFCACLSLSVMLDRDKTPITTSHNYNPMRNFQPSP